MYAKIIISGELEVLTGMHIGGSDAFSAIGATDSPIIKDPVGNLPMIPGSSLKGKMRTLLARQYNEALAKSPNEDDDRIKRLFGSSESKTYKTARLIFSDMLLKNGDALREQLDSLTEVKFENTINRISAEANPRQIERAVRGSKFDIALIYEISRNASGDFPAREEILEDFDLLANGFRLLTYDYIGGNGSRGYGRVGIKALKADVAVGELADGLDLKEINEKLYACAL
ncbi:MAG: type III-A CRISPR-associated RAMP protein Csm3 [Clostridiales Family XIII bacterium]|jgi:CRISPR-associated protein Csm3|nr:type III-A CRISPR-associated RAMP protein Csm3 [Clostridiales Family XIII bacterium]